MSATGCGLREPPRKFSRPRRWPRFTALRRDPARDQCDLRPRAAWAPIPRTRGRSLPRWCGRPPARSTAGATCPVAGLACREHSALAVLAGGAIVGWQLWQRQTPLHASAHKTSTRSRHYRPRPPLRPPRPPPAGAPAAVPAVSINALLAANSANTSDAAAFRRLLSLWGTAMADDKDPCGQAAKAGLVLPGATRLLGASQGLEPARPS